MNRRKIFIVVLVVSIAGLSIVQYQYLRIGLNLAKVQFNQKIGLTVKDIKSGLETQNELTFLIASAITEDGSYFKLNLDSVRGASNYFLNDFISDKLLQQGIKTDFSYSLYDRDSTNYLKSIQSYIGEETLLKYPIRLEGYLPEVLNKTVTLELQFKNLNRYFLFKLNGLTIPSLLFLMAIVFVVFWVLRSFYWQRHVITTTNEFINNLTHELKTPVFSIGLASKILEGKIKPEDKGLVELIRLQVDKLKSQIDKVLELASLEEEKGFLKKEIVDFKPAILNLAKSFGQLAEVESIEFKSTIEGEKYILNCDTVLLEGAIDSLLENAKKYSGERKTIDFKSYINGKKLYISIKDKGIGISEENQKKIFKKYFRVSNGDVHNVKGYGLGLNYVSRVVKLHKGRISVESELGEGSEFLICLPLNTYE